MGVPFTVLGDKTDHGGTVVSAAPTSITGGKPVARVGDKVPCPRCGNPNAVIVGPGDPTMIVDGAPVSLHGDKTTCGATIIASQMVTTAGGSGGASRAAATNLSPADEAMNSGADSFDDLPPKAKLHVFNDAANRGVFEPYEQGIYVAPSKYDESRDEDDKPILSTSDEDAYNKLIRQQLGASPYQPIDESQIQNTDPGAPKVDGLKPDGSSPLRKVTTIELTDGTAASVARTVDGRPLQGSPGIGDMEGTEPEVAKQFSRVSRARTAGTGVKGVIDKANNANALGKRGSAIIYQDPRSQQKVVFMQGHEENVQGTHLIDIEMTKSQVSERLNSDTSMSLDQQRQGYEKEALEKFYKDNFSFEN